MAFEAGPNGGRALAESTFHRFADYNWDVSSGCPSFVSERPGHGLLNNLQAMTNMHRYALNLARWLGHKAS